MNSSKKLIINADDYGACSKVNLAVEQLALTGRLSGVSVLANGDGWAQAVNFLRDHSELSAGVHLNVVEGQPISAVHKDRAVVVDVRLLHNGRPTTLEYCSRYSDAPPLFLDDDAPQRLWQDSTRHVFLITFQAKRDKLDALLPQSKFTLAGY